jgi:uncharacterized membrane protein
MQSIATFIVLSAAGLINAGHLAYKHFEKKPLVCPINHNCNAVVESRWGNMLGVRNEILGVIYYGAVLAGGLLLAIAPAAIPNLTLLLLLATGIGLIFSIFLTALQAFVIKDYCFYCLTSALVALLLFANSVIIFRS